MADPQLLEYTSRFYVDKLIVDQIGNVKNKYILDVGSGNGDFVFKLADMGAKVQGVDVSDEIIALARSKYPSLSFSRHDFTDAPFSQEKFDFVVLEFVAMFVKDLDKMLTNIKQNLTEEGMLVLSILHPFFVLSMQKDESLKVTAEEDEYFVEKVLKVSEGEIDTNYFSRSISWYVNLFTKLGFKIEEMIESNLKFSELDQLEKYSKIEDIPVVMLFKLSSNKI